MAFRHGRRYLHFANQRTWAGFRSPFLEIVYTFSPMVTCTLLEQILKCDSDLNARQMRNQDKDAIPYKACAMLPCYMEEWTALSHSCLGAAITWQLQPTLHIHTGTVPMRTTRTPRPPLF